MPADPTYLDFPFAIDARGRTATAGDDDHVRDLILQVLFTSPGERVNRPEFGCGLLNLVFEPNNAILVAATEFTIGQALARWLSAEIVVDAVSVEALDETMLVEVAYTKRRDLARQAVRIQFK